MTRTRNTSRNTNMSDTNQNQTEERPAGEGSGDPPPSPPRVTLNLDQLGDLVQRVTQGILSQMKSNIPVTPNQPQNQPRPNQEVPPKTHLPPEGQEIPLEESHREEVESSLKQDDVEVLSHQVIQLQEKIDDLKNKRAPRATIRKRKIAFAKEVMSESVKGDFRVPSLPKFDGKGDPQEHLASFDNTMELYNLSDSINARIFITTLTGKAQAWFAQLAEGSIRSYEELASQFVAHFASNKPSVRGVAHLYQIKQKEGESLRDFIQRFSDERLNVPNLTIEMVTNILIQGLNPGKFLSSLAMDPPDSMEALMKTAECYIHEEDVYHMKRQERKRKNEDQLPIQKRKASGYTPLDVSLSNVPKVSRSRSPKREAKQ